MMNKEKELEKLESLKVKEEVSKIERKIRGRSRSSSKEIKHTPQKKVKRQQLVRHLDL